MTNPVFESVKTELQSYPKRWLLTGVAGFIGSHLLECLLKLGQTVIGIDNFATGSEANLEDVRKIVGEDAWRKFSFVYGDICDQEVCKRACSNIDIVLHQAALGSVPRSIHDPIGTNRVNVEGTLRIFEAAVKAGVKRIVFASSSSVYGDIETLRKVESELGEPLSPYASSKRACELYASAFSKNHSLTIVGLRYFNVFGPRQNPNGEYAAVIPRWIHRILAGERGKLFGDGSTTRDFCFIDNVVSANILAATSPAISGWAFFNIGAARQTTLKDLYAMIANSAAALGAGKVSSEPEYEDFRPGDVAHSLASIDKATRGFGYHVLVDIDSGVRQTVAWFSKQAGQKQLSKSQKD